MKTMMIPAFLLLVLASQGTHAEDWQAWIERRTAELQEQQKQEHAKKCDRLHTEMLAGLSALKTEWELTGPSKMSRSVAYGTKEKAGRMLINECERNFSVFEIYKQLRTLIELLPE